MRSDVIFLFASCHLAKKDVLRHFRSWQIDNTILLDRLSKLVDYYLLMLLCRCYYYFTLSAFLSFSLVHEVKTLWFKQSRLKDAAVELLKIWRVHSAGSAVGLLMVPDSCLQTQIWTQIWRHVSSYKSDLCFPHCKVVVLPCCWASCSLVTVTVPPEGLLY